MAELVFYRRGEELMRVSLEHPKLSLGRGPQNDVAIPDSAVSRQQASVERRGGKAFLVDLSGRGTSVDGPHRVTLAPSFVSAQMSERATRL